METVTRQVPRLTTLCPVATAHTAGTGSATPLSRPTWVALELPPSRDVAVGPCRLWFWGGSIRSRWAFELCCHLHGGCSPRRRQGVRGWSSLGTLHVAGDPADSLGTLHNAWGHHTCPGDTTHALGTLHTPWGPAHSPGILHIAWGHCTLPKGPCMMPVNLHTTWGPYPLLGTLHIAWGHCTLPRGNHARYPRAVHAVPRFPQPQNHAGSSGCGF